MIEKVVDKQYGLEIGTFSAFFLEGGLYQHFWGGLFF